MTKVYRLGPPLLPMNELRHQRPPLAKAVLPDGCYRLHWLGHGTERFEGSLRVHRLASGVPDISGDLYEENPAALPYQAGDEIPVYARDRYRHYLQFTRVLELPPYESGVELGFTRVRRKRPKSVLGTAAWDEDGRFSVSLRPSGAGSYVGEVNADGVCVASMNLVWVSRWLRAATIEIDHEQGIPVPVGNGDRIGWATLGSLVDWQFTRLRPQQVIPPSPDARPWNVADLHAAMLRWRDQDVLLDQEWRYHLLCVGRLEDEDRGLMYDVKASDGNVVREGAAIASNWVFPKTPEWGDLGGKEFGSVPEAYFRTAAHEIGHAMGLFHDGDCRCFLMRPTEGLAKEGKGSAHPFPANIDWTFDEADQLFLRHAPDPLVRPGGDWPNYPLDTGDEYKNAVAADLELSVLPLISKLPLGAPVRVQLQLRWKQSRQTGAKIKVPTDLSLAGSNISGLVMRRGSDKARPFHPLLIRCPGGKLKELSPDEAVGASLTLLRGGKGALFPVPGDYDIEVTLRWADDAGHYWKVTGKTIEPITVSKLRHLTHARAAKASLKQPDTLLTLVLGGDHLKAGVAAIEAAMKDRELRPHYAWIEAKRLAGRPKPDRRDLREAARLIDIGTVLSQSEREKVRKVIVPNVGWLQKRRVERCLLITQVPSRLPRWLNVGIDRILRIALWVLMQ